MKIVQIMNDGKMERAHWIFDPMQAFGKNGMPEGLKYPDGTAVLFIDITGNDEVKEGWYYNAETGVFTEPPIVIPEPLSKPELTPPSPAEQAQLDGDELMLDMYLLQLEMQQSLQAGGGRA